MAWPKGVPRKPRADGAPEPMDEDIDQMNEGEDVVYLPGEGDPVKLKWRGVEFTANVPLRLTDEGHIAAARGNRFFRVGAGGPVDNPNLPPSDAMGYRAHVVDWIKRVETVEDVIVNWSNDRNLRTKCEVGEDDIRYLGTLVEPKLKKLRVSEGLSDAQVAAVWIKHGILDLPWRA